MTFVGANKVAVVSAGVRMHICACNDVLDISIIVSAHNTARSAGLELELVRLATKSNGSGARVACRCALGGTLHPFGARASRRVRIQRNDTVPHTQKLTQVG